MDATNDPIIRAIEATRARDPHAGSSAAARAVEATRKRKPFNDHAEPACGRCGKPLYSAGEPLYVLTDWSTLHDITVHASCVYDTEIWSGSATRLGS